MRRSPSLPGNDAAGDRCWTRCRRRWTSRPASRRQQKAAQADVDAAAAQAAPSGPSGSPAEAKDAYDQLAAARDKINAALDRGRLPRRGPYEIDERGLVVHIVADAVLFDAEQAVLRPEGKVVLDAVAPDAGRACRT